MFDDSTRLPRGIRIDCDVAIAGAGAAGITIAAELASAGLSVIVLESGGMRFERQTQDLYRGTVDDPVHHGPLAQYRRRCFGGTTTVWGGRCSPFDPIDFEQRRWVPDSGWPVDHDEMRPYYERAHHYADVGEFTYDTTAALPEGGRPLIPGLRSSTVYQDRIWRFSLPTNFGVKHYDCLKRSSVRVLLHANVLKILSNDAGDTVEGLRVSSLAGNTFAIRARQYVLAAGGLEVTRLLLLSNDVNPAGLGNDHDLVGRYYGSHVTGDLGEVTLTPRGGQVIWDYECTRDGIYAKRHLRISAGAQRQHQLLNFRCHLTHPAFADPSHGHAVLSAAYLAKRLLAHQIPPEFSGEMAKAEYRQVSRHVRNVVCGPLSLAAFGTHWLLRRTLATRKYPSVSLPSRADRYTVHFDAEQAPNAASRVTLGDDVDRFGLRRLRVQWRYSDLDIDSVAQCHRLIVDDFERSRIGRCHLRPEAVPEMVQRSINVGSHHLGTTRMADSPRAGVVDRNGRLHSVRNLYISSPSIFCTSSFANPLLTNTAFAIRLADHLRRRS
jgi:choline dehydrogenase-like flavoprotein